jgi:hypothetical protein
LRERKDVVEVETEAELSGENEVPDLQYPTALKYKKWGIN